MTRRILCVVPARGGSKGIVRKNLALVAGQPLITWTVQQALASTAELRVLVSTDDPEIAECARAAGADVPFLRPPALATDDAPTEPVVLHAIDHEVQAGRSPDLVLLLQPTSPVRLPGTIDRAIAEFDQRQADSMVGVVAEPPFLWRPGEPPLPEYDLADRPRRQDVEPWARRYRETGSLYLTAVSVYQRFRNRLGGRVVLFEMDELEGIDVDTEFDLWCADAVLRRLAGDVGS